jgi:hypothetical protein
MSKDEKITIRLKSNELEYISKKSEELYISKSEFCRQAIVEAKVISKKPSVDLLYELNRIGNNLNQITKRININKAIDRVVIYQLDEIEQQLELIRSKFL